MRLAKYRKYSTIPRNFLRSLSLWQLADKRPIWFLCHGSYRSIPRKTVTLNNTGCDGREDVFEKSRGVRKLLTTRIGWIQHHGFAQVSNRSCVVKTDGTKAESPKEVIHVLQKTHFLET